MTEISGNHGSLSPDEGAQMAATGNARHARHTQAAYDGPTLDNPSLSLKTRLKRAHFFDQRERKASELLA